MTNDLQTFPRHVRAFIVAFASRKRRLFAERIGDSVKKPAWFLPSPGDPQIMNRLTAVPQLPKSTSTAIARVQRPVLRKTIRPDSPHCLMSPVHYEPAYAYPLLVWLHSAGTSEREVQQIVPLISERNYVALGVRGP